MLRGQLIQKCIKVNWFQLWTIVLLFGGLSYTQNLILFIIGLLSFFLGVNKYTSTPVIHGDMDWDPPLIRRKVSMLRLWKRLICMDNTRLTQNIFLWNYSKCRNNWSHKVKKVLVDIGNIVAIQSCSLVNCENPRHFLQGKTETFR